MARPERDRSRTSLDWLIVSAWTLGSRVARVARGRLLIVYRPVDEGCLRSSFCVRVDASDVRDLPVKRKCDTNERPVTDQRQSRTESLKPDRYGADHPGRRARRGANVNRRLARHARG